MRLYTDLTAWYRLLDPLRDHEDEGTDYGEVLVGAIRGPAETLLELGAGAGNNAFYLKRRFRCTLTDQSDAMLALSREINPDCEHLPGDMRTLRLNRTFDAVLVHDAVVYLTTKEDVAKAAATAFVHTRPGGAAIFAPDLLRETFRETTALTENEDGARSLRSLEWTWDPDPADDTYQVDFAFLLRDGREMTAVHDQHVEGLFAEATWRRVLSTAGFDVETFERPDGAGRFDRIFLCRRNQEAA